MIKQFRNSSGFSLVELMIVVAIIGILSAVAAPAYMNYMNRNREATGIQYLLDLKVAQEKYNGLFDSYAVGATFHNAAFKDFASFAMDDTTYYLYTSVGNATTYTITGCFDLNQDGNRTDCWLVTEQPGDPQPTGGPSNEGFSWSLIGKLF